MSEEPALLAIGGFSRASSISVRTLRNYHESGLLVPASIDPATGYRSYTVDQLADAMAIVRLRDLDVPLPIVHQILSARDPDVTRELLVRHEQTMRERVREAERIVAELRRGVPDTLMPLHMVATDHTLTLQRSSTVAATDLWNWLGESASQLARLAGDRLTPQSSFGALYTAALEDESTERVTAFVQITEPVFVPGARHDPDTSPSVGELPSGSWAALTHTGGFASVGDTYRILGAWVARHATAKPDGSICELYPDLLTTADPSDRVIEIRWPTEVTHGPVPAGAR